MVYTIVSVCAFIENYQNEILLVKTHVRSDTWEFPGGQVEKGESLDDAVHREVKEETGVLIYPIGITGVYQNLAVNVLCIVFYARYVSGQISKQVEEIQEARFVKLNETNFAKYITRPNFQSRYFDALTKKTGSAEIWENKLHLIKRYENTSK